MRQDLITMMTASAVGLEQVLPWMEQKTGKLWLVPIPIYGTAPDGTEAVEHLACGCPVDLALMEELLVIMGIYQNDPKAEKQPNKAGTCVFPRDDDQPHGKKLEIQCGQAIEIMEANGNDFPL
ncbi:hypothetical protein ABEF93_003976 [Exophiala dermatitidis]